MNERYPVVPDASIEQLMPLVPAAMDEALSLARRAAAEDEVPVGAVVVRVANGEVVGRGYNRREQDQTPLGHAEMMAIEDAAKALGSWRLHECALVVTLEPCPMCLAAAQQARLAVVIYGAKDPKGGALSLGYHLHEDTRINHRFPVRYLESPEAARILKDFFSIKRAAKKKLL